MSSIEKKPRKPRITKAIKESRAEAKSMIYQLLESFRYWCDIMEIDDTKISVIEACNKITNRIKTPDYNCLHPTVVTVKFNGVDK